MRDDDGQESRLMLLASCQLPWLLGIQAAFGFCYFGVQGPSCTQCSVWISESRPTPTTPSTLCYAKSWFRMLDRLARLSCTWAILQCSQGGSSRHVKRGREARTHFRIVFADDRTLIISNSERCLLNVAPDAWLCLTRGLECTQLHSARELCVRHDAGRTLHHFSRGELHVCC